MTVQKRIKHSVLTNFKFESEKLASIIAAEQTAEKVIRAAKEHIYLQPFKDFMTDFFEKGKKLVIIL